GSAMVFIDQTAVNVALPVLQNDLHADIAQVQWIVEAYALFLSALVLVGGSQGDHFGRRRVFAIGVIAFTVCSMLCGIAPDARLMIAARSVQGIAGALLVPSSLAIISASFGEDRGHAIGTWSSLTSLMLALGPVLGGWLVQHFSWRWVFFINLPLGAIVLFLTLRCVPESRDPHAGPLDPLGTFLAVASLGGIVFGLIEASVRGLHAPIVWISVAIGTALLVLFLLHEHRSASPLLPLELFRSRLFSACNVLTLLLYAALSGALFYVPFNLIQIQHYSPSQAGAANLPMIAMVVLLSPRAGKLMDRYGPKPLLIAGPTIAGIGFALLAMPSIGGSYWTTFFPGSLIMGLGMSITVAPLTTAVMSAAGDRSGIASGINNAVARTAGLLAVAAFSVLFVARYTTELESRVTLPPQAKAAVTAQASRLADIRVVDPRVKREIDQSFVAAFRLSMFVAAGLALASALVAALWIDGQPIKAA
ncbi:MAG: drug resistance transporter, EmrB/QacA subfamily, partial [Acidobacteria bacterium]|nr:drug resistance transporter, EmrB/QacA subfamily [Acidobacteriota bacterium]